MSKKEREKHHRKGIFTVTQLSHTFRHRKRSGEAHHDHALKALAIRKNQVHVLGKVAWGYSGTPVYIDVEGDADRDFYYCIGLRFEVAGSIVQRSYWADDASDEERMWVECLVALNAIDEPRLIHYGSYETFFLRQMKKRYPSPSIALDGLLESSVNLLAVVYAQVYFPTYSNGLKDIARHLGFRWSHPAASGLAALSWRRQWEVSREPELKQRLLIYNQEDCAAAQTVAEALAALSRSLPVGATDFVDATALYGGTGNDTYSFSSGGGTDLVYENSGEGTDTIAFHGINPSDVTITDNTSGELIIQYGTSDFVYVENGSYNSSTGFTLGNIEQISFDDSGHTTWDLTSGLNLLASGTWQGMYGTSGADTLTSTGYGNLLEGFAGDDTFVAGGTNADIYGGGGADTFKFTNASASNTIHDFSTSDGDKLDFSAILTGYDPLHNGLGDWIQETVSGSNTIIKVDVDGTGSGSTMTQVALLSGVTGLSDIATLVANGTVIV